MYLAKQEDNIHPHFTGNDKGLYATMIGGSIDPCYMVIFVVQKGITLTPQVGNFELLKIERGKLTWSKNLNVRISKILGISCDNVISLHRFCRVIL